MSTSRILCFLPWLVLGPAGMKPFGKAIASFLGNWDWDVDVLMWDHADVDIDGKQSVGYNEGIRSWNLEKGVGDGVSFLLIQAILGISLCMNHRIASPHFPHYLPLGLSSYSITTAIPLQFSSMKLFLSTPPAIGFAR